MNPERERQLEYKIENANRIIRISVVSMMSVIIVMLIIVVIHIFTIETQVKTIEAQISKNLDEIKASGAANHKRTQQYIKCIATTLLRPLAERTAETFDKCGIEGVSDKSQAKTQSNASQGASSKAPEANPKSSPSKPADTPAEEIQPSIIDRLIAPMKSILNTTGGK